jgi:hypothetical protein
MTEKKNAFAKQRTSLHAPVPRPEDVTGGLKGYGSGREEDGRTARKTGRTVYFNTVVSPDFKAWLKAESGLTGKTMAALLDDMRAAYEEKKRERR